MSFQSNSDGRYKHAAKIWVANYIVEIDSREATTEDGVDEGAEIIRVKASSVADPAGVYVER